MRLVGWCFNLLWSNEIINILIRDFSLFCSVEWATKWFSSSSSSSSSSSRSIVKRKDRWLTLSQSSVSIHVDQQRQKNLFRITMENEREESQWKTKKNVFIRVKFDRGLLTFLRMFFRWIDAKKGFWRSSIDDVRKKLKKIIDIQPIYRCRTPCVNQIDLNRTERIKQILNNKTKTKRKVNEKINDKNKIWIFSCQANFKKWRNFLSIRLATHHSDIFISFNNSFDRFRRKFREKNSHFLLL